MFVLQGQKPICLLCYEAVSVVKEYNLRQYAKISLREKKKFASKIKGQTVITAKCVRESHNQKKPGSESWCYCG